MKSKLFVLFELKMNFALVIHVAVGPNGKKDQGDGRFIFYMSTEFKVNRRNCFWSSSSSLSIRKWLFVSSVDWTARLFLFPLSCQNFLALLSFHIPSWWKSTSGALFSLLLFCVCVCASISSHVRKGWNIPPFFLWSFKKKKTISLWALGDTAPKRFQPRRHDDQSAGFGRVVYSFSLSLSMCVCVRVCFVVHLGVGIIS